MSPQFGQTRARSVVLGTPRAAAAAAVAVGAVPRRQVAGREGGKGLGAGHAPPWRGAGRAKRSHRRWGKGAVGHQKQSRPERAKRKRQSASGTGSSQKRGRRSRPPLSAARTDLPCSRHSRLSARGGRGVYDVSRTRDLVWRSPLQKNQASAAKADARKQSVTAWRQGPLRRRSHRRRWR